MDFRTNKKTGKKYPINAEMTDDERKKITYDNHQNYLKTQDYLKNHSWQPEAKPEREEHYCQLCDKRLQEWRYNNGNIPELCGACTKDKGKAEAYDKKKELQRQSAKSRSTLEEMNKEWIRDEPNKIEKIEREQLLEKRLMKMSDKEKDDELIRLGNKDSQ